jgi:hypothetical protein
VVLASAGAIVPLSMQRERREIEKISAISAFSAAKNSEVGSTTPDGETIPSCVLLLKNSSQ